jgi:hypothetical protein
MAAEIAIKGTHKPEPEDNAKIFKLLTKEFLRTAKQRPAAKSGNKKGGEKPDSSM